MAESPDYSETQLLSKGLYRKVSDEVGPECLIKYRRLECDINDDFVNCGSSFWETRKTSGSRSEGFQLRSSDQDSVYIDRRVKVLTELRHLTLPYIKIPSLFVMETDNVPPGSTLLKLLRCDPNNTNIFDFLVWRKGEIYLSSKHVRESFLSYGAATIHGPCQTFRGFLMEADFAYALSCPVWPIEASSFVTRSLDKGWPTYDVLTDVLQDGCLFVPVNSNHQNYRDLEEIEWRISFSKAETKIIRSMNQCQFLCYGLLKLYLNEVLKKIVPRDDLLCSYFMKTAMCWEISEDSNDWTVYNFFPKFWDVFRRLLKWVSDGYCPNVFIPDNNMFSGKIYGQNQRMLLVALRGLYLEGYGCLLRCAPLKNVLSIIIERPDAARILPLDEKEYVPASNIEKRKMLAILGFDALLSTKMVDGNTVMHLLNSTSKMKIQSEVMRHAVMLRMNYILEKFAENLLLGSNTSSERRLRNKKKYTNIQKSQLILSRRNTYLCFNDLIYAKYMYMAGSYHKAIDTVLNMKQKLRSQQFMYHSNLKMDVILTKLKQGLSYVEITQNHIACDVEMDISTTLDELQLECQVKQENIGSQGFLLVSPVVFANFLLFLCYSKTGDEARRFEVLNELQELAHVDDGVHITRGCEVIYWEILGICHQLCGHNKSAYFAYMIALNHKLNLLREATVLRLESLPDVIEDTGGVTDILKTFF